MTPLTMLSKTLWAAGLTALLWVAAPMPAAAAWAQNTDDAARLRPAGPGGDALLWLSDLPPQRSGAGHGMGGRMGGSRGGPAPEGAALPGMGGGADDNAMRMSGMGTREQPFVKRLWLRQGANPATARPAALADDAAVLLLDANGQPAPAQPAPPQSGAALAFAMPVSGFYNAYVLRETVDAQGTRHVVVAKAEAARSAGHGSGEDAQADLAPKTDARVPVELIRERKDEEGFFTRINYGDVVTFQLLRQGQPVPGTMLTFTTGQGWSKTQASDAEGRARFIVVRDYYPPWNEFDRRHRETYVVSAAFGADEPGNLRDAVYQKTRYGTSLSGAYYPSARDYESYAYGLLIGVASLLVAVFSIYFYRRRRVQPYREVSFRE